MRTTFIIRNVDRYSGAAVRGSNGVAGRIRPKKYWNYRWPCIAAATLERPELKPIQPSWKIVTSAGPEVAVVDGAEAKVNTLMQWSQQTNQYRLYTTTHGNYYLLNGKLSMEMRRPKRDEGAVCCWPPLPRLLELLASDDELLDDDFKKRAKFGSWLSRAKRPSEKSERAGGVVDSGDRRGGMTGGLSLLRAFPDATLNTS